MEERGDQKDALQSNNTCKSAGSVTDQSCPALRYARKANDAPTSLDTICCISCGIGVMQNRFRRTRETWYDKKAVRRT